MGVRLHVQGVMKAEADGFYVEVAEGGPWLGQDGSVVIEFEERGIWPTYRAAAEAIADSLRE